MLRWSTEADDTIGRRRLVVFLRYFGDLSYSEIAVLTGVREGTVASTLAHARASLLATLEHERVIS